MVIHTEQKEETAFHNSCILKSLQKRKYKSNKYRFEWVTCVPT